MYEALADPARWTFAEARQAGALQRAPCPMGQVGEGASALLLMQDKLATGITFLSQLDASVGSRLFHDETGMVENRAPLYVLDFTGKSQARHRRNG